MEGLFEKTRTLTVTLLYALGKINCKRGNKQLKQNKTDSQMSYRDSENKREFLENVKIQHEQYYGYNPRIIHYEPLVCNSTGT